MPAKITERELRQDLALKINDKVPADHLGDTGSAHGNATQIISGFMSGDDKTKLDGIEPGSQVNTVNTVAGRTGDIVLSKNDVGLNNLTNDTQIKKRVSSTNNNIPTWNGIAGDELNDGYSIEDNLLGGSNSLARADAIKSYIDGLLSANDAMVFKGTIDCSSNPNYPVADAGETWKVSIAGKIGGVNGPRVEMGDMIICIVDGTISGDHITVGSNFNIIQSNLDGAVIGPESAINNNFIYFDGATGKLIKDSGYTYSSFTPFSHIGTTGNSHGIATDLVNGFMSNIDKIKLNNIADNANNYVHPLNHPPSIISQDENNRFVTDAEKTTWNNKSNLALGESSTTAYRGDRGKIAYDHSQAPHAPIDAQKNSEITKAEIEEKLIGTITSHTHDPSVPSGHASSHYTGGSDEILPSNIGAEPAFTKNTGFNKNFGSTTGTVAQGDDSRFHSNSNDPSIQEKQALAGTNGVPSNANRYVTNEDSRMSDARTPLSHSHTETDLPTASTSTKGIVQLSNDINSTSTALAATANSIKLVNDSIKTKIQTLRNREILALESNTVNIGIAGFDKTKDSLTVYQNSTYIAEDYEYSIDSNGVSIINNSGNWSAGTIFDFQVMTLI